MLKRFVWFALLAPLAAGAEDAAVSATPYLALYEVLAPVQVIRGYDRLLAIERVDSKSPGIRAQDIRITIRAKRGAIAVPLAADGSVEFPTDDALRAENPVVETNQPKGSLMLTVHAALRVPAALDLPWSEIEAGLRQAEELFAKGAGGGNAAKVRGVEILFAPGPAASVTLSGRSERLFKADEGGRVIVTRDMIVEKESPRLQLSRRAQRMLPYVGD